MSWKIPEFVLSTLKNAKKLTPIPYLRDAADVVLRIIETTQAVKHNPQAFQWLANDACALVYIILWLANRDTAGVAGSTPPHSQELLETLHNIHNYTKSRASRNRFIRMIQHRSDVGIIQEYRERLKQFLGVFKSEPSISIQDTLASVQVRMVQIQHQQEHGKRQQPGDEQANTADEGRPTQNSNYSHLPTLSLSTSDPFHPHQSYHPPSMSFRSGSSHSRPPSSHGATPHGILPGFTPAGPASPASHPSLQSPISALQFPPGFSPQNYTSIGGDQNTYTNSLVTSHEGGMTTYNHGISSRRSRGRGRRR